MTFLKQQTPTFSNILVTLSFLPCIVTLQSVLEVTVFFIYGTLQLTNIHLHGEDILTLDYGSACILVYMQYYCSH